MVKLIKQIKLNRPMKAVAANSDPTRGTAENPYTTDEMYSLYYAGKWTGGWVETFGLLDEELNLVAEWVTNGSLYPSDYDPFAEEEEENNPNNTPADEDNEPAGGDAGFIGGGGGNTDGGDNTGGDGTGGGGHNDGNNQYNSQTTQDDNPWTKNMCLFSCIAFVFNKLYENEIAQQSTDGEIKKTTFGKFYCDGISNHKDLWEGTHNEADKYAPEPFDEDNNPNAVIITFLRCFFNTTDWETSKNTVNTWTSTLDGDYIIGIFNNGQQKHALIIKGYDSGKEKYIVHDPSQNSSDTSSGKRNASGLLFAVKLSRK